MPNLSKFNFLSDLQMPLRDALRGVAYLADATDDALEPAAKLLPETFRYQFRAALESIEETGKRLITTPIETDQIRMAAQFITRSNISKEAQRDCTLVIIYAWQHLQEVSANHCHIISETIIADRLFRASRISKLSGAEFTANLIMDIRKSSAIGRMPGFVSGITAEEKAKIDLALVSIAVWLLSSRAGKISEEEKVLDLAFALVRALHDDILDAIDDCTMLSQLLLSTSAHL